MVGEGSVRYLNQLSKSPSALDTALYGFWLLAVGIWKLKKSTVDVHEVGNNLSKKRTNSFLIIMCNVYRWQRSKTPCSTLVSLSVAVRIGAICHGKGCALSCVWTKPCWPDWVNLTCWRELHNWFQLLSIESIHSLSSLFFRLGLLCPFSSHALPVYSPRKHWIFVS